jgi:hypothetical protein
MKKGTISIPDIDFDYKLWKNLIDFQRKQIRTYLIRINELKYVEKNDSNQSLLDIELSLNNLKADLLELNKMIKLQEEQISAHASDYPINRSHEHFEAHEMIHLSKKEAERRLSSIDNIFNQYRI